MSATRFLELVEQQGLLEANVLAGLRKQVTDKPGITAASVAKLLVDKGHLTKFQATKLVGEAEDVSAAMSPPTRKAAAPPPPAAAPPPADDDELTFAPPPATARPPATAPPPADDDLTFLPEPGAKAETTAEYLVDLEEVSVEPVKPSATVRSQPQAKPASTAPKPAAPKAAPKKVAPAPGLTPIADAGLTPMDAGLLPIGGPGGLAPFGDPSAGMMGLGMPGDAGFGGFGGMGGDPLAAQNQPQESPVRLSGNVWDSKLLLIGGGVLILMLIGGAVLWFSLNQGNAQQAFNAAEDDYKGQSYTNAVQRYEKFLKQFPSDVNASKARVRIGTAKLRQTIEIGKNPHQGLKEAREMLPVLEKEKDFSEALPELASLLPEIASGFAAKAKVTPGMNEAQELVDLAEQAMTLVQNPSYVPSSLLKTQLAKIDTIKEDLALAHRAINQDKRLRESLAAMDQAVAASDTVKAFGIRRTLVKEYPSLETHADLREASLKVAAREKDLVRVENKETTPVSDEEAATTEFRVVLSSRKGPAVAGEAKQVAFVLASGAVYGLDVANGSVLWRRYVGYETLIHPQPASSEAGADAIVVDSLKQELMRLSAHTGKSVWRLPIGEPFVAPRIAGDKIFLATKAGRLLEIAADTGTSTRQSVLPQSTNIGPAVHESGARIYQPGGHSNVYLLNAQTLACDDVFYLGHQAGTLAVPPHMVAGYLFIAENAGEDFSFVHVLVGEANGLSLKPAMPRLRLKGLVRVPPVIVGRRLVYLTDLGAVYVYNVNPEKPDAPVTNAVQPLVASHPQPLLGYHVVDRTSLWIGESRLTKYEIQATTEKLVRPSPPVFDGDTFTAPLQVFGELILHVRRQQNALGITITALQSSTGQQVWRTDVGVPFGRLTVAAGKIQAVSAQGELYAMSNEVLKKGYLDQPTAVARNNEQAREFRQAIELDNNRVAFYSPADGQRLLMFDPAADAAQPVRFVKATAIDGVQMTDVPVAFAGGLLVPLDNGQVALLDPQSGGSKCLPFDSRREPGVKIQWRRPAVLGTEFVITDDQQNVYRVGQKPQPQPHLAQAAQNKVASPALGALASVGGTIYGVTRGGRGDVVITIQPGDLAAGMEFPLEGRVTWGPELVGDAVFLVTDDRELRCFEAGPKLRWSVPLKYGALAGRPLADGADFILASINGNVWRIAGGTGEELKQTAIGQPLGAGPVGFGTRLLLTGSDGVLHVIPKLNP